MDVNTLVESGLNDSQAKAYLALIRSGKLTPPKLAEHIHTTRTNAYELLKQLEGLGLAIKSESDKKMAFSPSHPNSIQNLLQTRRQALFDQEAKMNNMMPQLLSFFYTYSEQPGIRLLHGREGVLEVYKDILRTKEDIYLIRTPVEKNIIGKSTLKEYIKQRVAVGIRVTALTPLMPDSNFNPQKDEGWLMTRHWYAPSTYTAPVEITIYGEKVALISYGKEVMATIIQSQPIALAMKQLFNLIISRQ